MIDADIFSAGWADKVQGRTIDTGKDRLTYTLHEPIGVCGQIIPWNFPLAMFAWKVAPAIACGNTVVMKPAEQTPLSVLYLATIIKDIFPPGAINICPGYGKTAGAPLVQHRDVRKVAFTGSTVTGRQILKMTADSEILKKVTLELGGKSPLVVLEDADLDQAVKWAHLGMFYNQSQVCCSTTRILIQSTIYDEFTRLFVKHTQETSKVGQPEADGTFQGPQISKLQHDKILNYIKVGKAEGAEVLLDGGKAEGDLIEGYFINPTIFGQVKPDMRISREEVRNQPSNNERINADRLRSLGPSLHFPPLSPWRMGSDSPMTPLTVSAQQSSPRTFEKVTRLLGNFRRVRSGSIPQTTEREDATMCLSLLS